MKNIGASVGAVPTQEKKQTELEKIVEQGGKYIRKENEVIFCLDEDREYQIVNISISNTYQKIEMSTSFPIL